MELLTVNQKLCVKCGMCAQVCPNRIIGMNDKGPEMRYAPACIACGQCTAVCPYGALENVKAPLAKQVKLDKFPVIDQATAAQFLRSRRSIRCYRKESVPKDKIIELLNIARFAPSGCNSQGLSYVVVSKQEQLAVITEKTVEWLENQLKSGVEWAKPFAGVTEIYRSTGTDIILREAPHLIVATASQNFPMGHDNARFALEYVELYATSMGLGTCWAGFVEMAAGYQYEPLLAAMNIKSGMAVVGTMMLGYPKFGYRRLVNRNPLQVSWIE